MSNIINTLEGKTLDDIELDEFGRVIIKDDDLLQAVSGGVSPDTQPDGINVICSNKCTKDLL